MTTEEIYAVIEKIAYQEIRNKLRKYTKNNEKFDSFANIIIVYSTYIALYKQYNDEDYPIPKTLKELWYEIRNVATLKELNRDTASNITEELELYISQGDEINKGIEVCKNILNNKYNKDLTIEMMSEVILDVSETFLIGFDCDDLATD